MGIPALEEALAETPPTTLVDRGLNHTEVVAGIAERLGAKADRYLAALDRLAVALRESQESQGTSVAALDPLKTLFRIRIRRKRCFLGLQDMHPELFIPIRILSSTSKKIKTTRKKCCGSGFI